MGNLAGRQTRFEGGFSLLLLILLVVPVLLDAVGVFGGEWLWIGAGVWVGLYVVMGIIALRALWSLLSSWSFFSIGALTLLSSFFLLGYLDPRNVSHESTQQLACALEKFHTWADYGYGIWCFLGYPTRQYYIPSIPTLITGPTLGALNFGGFIYLFLGALVFLGGLRSLFENERRGDPLAASSLLLICQLAIFFYIFVWFEQSIYPLAHSLLVSGLFAFYLSRRIQGALELFALGLLLTAFVYTPGLAVTGLGIGTLVFVTILSRDRKIRIRAGLLALLVSSGAALSFGLREDIRFKSRPEALVDIPARLREIPKVISVTEMNGGLFLPPLTIAFLFGTVIAIGLLVATFIGSRRRDEKTDFRDQLLAALGVPFVLLWSVGAIIAAAIFPGYANPPTHFAMHRAGIIVPPFLLAVAVCLRYVQRGKAIQFGLFAASTLYLGFQAHTNYSREVQGRFPDRKFQLIDLLSKEKLLIHNEPTHLFFESQLERLYGNTGDYLLYFSPQSTHSFPKGCEQMKEKRSANRRFVWLSYGGAHPCVSEKVFEATSLPHSTGSDPSIRIQVLRMIPEPQKSEETDAP
jgi:hypothetical protein